MAPQIQSIIRIVLNTLESQYHRCRYGGIGATITHAHPSGQITSGIRTREQSQASFSTDGDALATEASDSANRTPRAPGKLLTVQRCHVEIQITNKLIEIIGMMSHGVGLSTVLGIAGLGWGASGNSPLHSAPSKTSAPSGRLPHREPGGSVSSECDLDASDMDGIELEVRRITLGLFCLSRSLRSRLQLELNERFVTLTEGYSGKPQKRTTGS